MFESMRKIFGPIAVSVIIGAIALVFVISGVFDNPGNRGMGGGSAATVNGDSISMDEFSREYQQRIDFYSNMMKGKADPALLKQLGVGQQVIEELIRRKLMLQEAERLNMVVSDDEVREKIKELPYFKSKDGKFDVSRYESILSANRYSPAAFEDNIRHDLMRNRVIELVRGRAKVSDREVRDEFMASEDRRQVDYVALTPQTAKKLLVVSDKEVDDFLKTEANINEAKAHYERTRFMYAKKDSAKVDKKAKKTPTPPEFQSFDEVKRKVAVDLLKERRVEEATKANRELAKDILEKAKSMAPAQFKAYVKSKDLEVQTTEKFNRLGNFLPGMGEMPELVGDAFKDASPLSQGPKLYESGRTFVIAQNLKAFKPDVANFEKEREKLVKSASARKEQQLYEAWMTELRGNAKVAINKAVTDPGAEDEGGSSAPPVAEPAAAPAQE